MGGVHGFAASTRPGRGADLSLWGLQVLLASAFFGAGGLKLAGADAMVTQLATLGFGQWFRYLTGALEVTAAVLFLMPRRSGFGGLLIVAIMLGAVAAHLLVFKSSPAIPLLFLALAVVVVWSRRDQFAAVLGDHRSMGAA